MNKSLFYDFAKMMFGAGQRIEPYVILNFITKDEFKEITGSEYPNKHLSTAVEVDSKDIPDYMQSTSPVSGAGDRVTQAEDVKKGS